MLLLISSDLVETTELESEYFKYAIRWGSK
nr:MAG TPA: hypothetical protein [Caudoviricetes sp.]DAN93393.1 MAG TPA: hypothetical protein [Caudoviricetes sp.]